MPETETETSITENEDNQVKKLLENFGKKIVYTSDDDDKIYKEVANFKDMDLNTKIIESQERYKYVKPTPIQSKGIPIILQNNDIIAMARTGSGKTLTYIIPLYQKILNQKNTRNINIQKSSIPSGTIYGLILVPTRELAQQVKTTQYQLNKILKLRICSIIGGYSMEKQFEQLTNNEYDIMVATPGRQLHHLLEIQFIFTNIHMLILDEADRLLEMGFSTQIIQIVSRIKPLQEYQKCLFSATIPKILIDFLNILHLKNPSVIRLDTDISLPKKIQLHFIFLRDEQKISMLIYLIKYHIPNKKQVLIFTTTRHHVECITTIFISLGISCIPIHGHLDNDIRNTNLELFRNNKVQVMIVTDIAARGIDIPQLQYSINYNIPSTNILFIHRIGRIARKDDKDGSIEYINWSLVNCSDYAQYLQLCYHFNWNNLININDDSITTNDVVNTNSTIKLPIVGRTSTIGEINDEYTNIQKILSQSLECATLYNSMKNADKQYIRTRKKPTDIQVLKYPLSYYEYDKKQKIHPHCIRDRNIETLDTLQRKISNYTPPQTIFEQKHDQSDMIRKKRMQHDPYIMKTQATKSDYNNSNIKKLDINYIDMNKKTDATKITNETAILRDSVQDIGFEDNKDLLKRRKVEKWNTKKHRFITDFERKDIFGKYIKNESGALVCQKENELGNRYLRWVTKKTNSIKNTTVTAKKKIPSRFKRGRSKKIKK